MQAQVWVHVFLQIACGSKLYGLCVQTVPAALRAKPEKNTRVPQGQPV